MKLGIYNGEVKAKLRGAKLKLSKNGLNHSLGKVLIRKSPQELSSKI